MITLSRQTKPTLIVFAMLFGLLLTSCTQRLPSYHYRLTVEVETPEGLRRGSSVIEVKNGLFRTINGGGWNWTHSAVGQAVSVDLGSRGTLFALLRGEGSSSWGPGELLYMLQPPPGVSDYVGAWRKRIEQISKDSGIHVLPNKLPGWSRGEISGYPLLVRFGNIADPLSIEQVDPQDLERAFGQGVKLKRVFVQVTSAPVTFDINRTLPWLTSDEGVLDPAAGPTTHPTFAQTLQYRDFWQRQHLH